MNEKNNPVQPTFITVQPTYKYAFVSSLPILFFSVLLIWLSFYFLEFKKILFLSSIVPLLLFAYNVLYITSKKYIFEKEQIIYKKGLFSISVDFLEMYRIKDYNKSRSFLFRLIGVQKITLETSDKSHPKLIITGIESNDLISKIRLIVEENRRARGVREFD